MVFAISILLYANLLELSQNFRFMKIIAASFTLATVALCAGLHAQSLNPQAQQRVDHIIAEAQDWVKSEAVVKAVTDQNQHPSSAVTTMTQEKWETLPDADPFVRAFALNAAAEYLKQKKNPAISEAFLSDANGCKVAFLAKPTYWCHKGKPKHDVPMTDRIWQGKVEVDRSSGGQQLQVSVPVLVDGKPVGSLVVGIAVSALVAD
jgi:hypothetical protein